MAGKTVMIASSKGGVGKSTVALGISRALAAAGKKVLLCDLDLGNACLDMLLGLEDDVVCTLQDAARGVSDAASAVIKVELPEKKKKRKKKDSVEGGLWFLPSSVKGEGCSPDRLGEDNPFNESIAGVVRDAAESVDAEFVILDTGAGINSAVFAAAEIADTALVVTGQMPVALRSAEATVMRLSELSVKDVRLVINTFDAGGVIEESRRGLFSVIDGSRAPLAGVVPYDYGLMLTHEMLGSAGEGSVQAFGNIAKRLQGESVPLFDGIKKLRKLKNKICL